MLGMFSDQNLAAAATLGGGVWSPTLPLTNLQSGGYTSAPTRQLQPGNEAAAWFDCALPWPRPVTLVGVLFHTLSPLAEYRLSLAPAAGSLDAPIYDSGWTAIAPRLEDSDDLPWEDPNWWTGQTDLADQVLYPRHLWLRTPELIAAAVRLQFRDPFHPAGYFDLGGLWVASSWSPKFNFSRGRQFDHEARDVHDEAPSGREFTEARQPRRSVTVSWAMLDEAELYRMTDAAGRAGSARAVMFVPDLDNEASLQREAFPATFRPLPGGTIGHAIGGSQLTATFREIIA